MDKFTKQYLEKLCKETGFIKDTLEKTLRLTEVLRYIDNDNNLKGKLALKGGTAINLTVIPLLRLSVDIDLDYSANSDKQQAGFDRTDITERLSSYMQQEGYFLKRQERSRYALSSQQYHYINSAGNQDSIKVEINYMDRAHILPLEYRTVKGNLDLESFDILSLNITELYASKINALLSRAAPRDLYDVYVMIKNNIISDTNMLRKCFVFYKTIGGNIQEKDINLDIIHRINERSIKTKLKPVLSKTDNFNLNIAINTVKEYLRDIMIFTQDETRFIQLFLEEKKYIPSLLFDDGSIIKRIENHPMAIWRTSILSEGKKENEGEMEM